YVGSSAMHRDHDGDADDIVVRDHAGNLPAPALRWATLIQDTRISGRREVFTVDSPRGFHLLQLKNCAGQTYIDKIVLTYASGQTRTLDPDVKLSARNPDLVLPIDYGKIRKVVVFGKSGARGRYTILAA